MDNVGSGAVQYLSGLSAITTLVGAFQQAPNAGVPWIFDSDVYGEMKGTQQAAIICSDYGPTASDVTQSSKQYRRLMVSVWVDPLRDTSGNITEGPARTKARGDVVYNQLRAVLHRIDPGTQVWGDMVTFYCQELSGPQWMPVPDGDHLLQGQSFFEVGISGWTDVQV